MNGYDPDELDPEEYTRVLKCLVTPRPIGWISTTSEDGIDNLAPFSCYNYVSSEPPAVMFRCGPRGEGLKDSARNALDTGEFVANLVTERVAERMDATGASLPPEESEFDDADIERAESARVAPPRVADAAAHMECTLYDSMRVHDSVLVVGEVEYFHVSDELTTDGRIDMHEVDTVGRLGGPYYTRIDMMDLQRSH